MFAEFTPLQIACLADNADLIPGTCDHVDIYAHMIHGMQDQAAKLMDEVFTPIPVGLSDRDEETLGKSQLHTIAHNKGDPLS